MPLEHHNIWQIDEAYLPTLLDRLRITGLRVADRRPNQVLPDKYLLKSEDYDRAKAWNRMLTERFSTDQRVLVLPIEGTMSRDTGYAFGNDFFMRQLESAANDPKYIGAVLAMDTPGGTADSNLAFGNTVQAFRARKPILTSTAYCMSAGYFVASQTDEIWMEDQAASGIGSIGTLAIYENRTKQLEQDGISMEILRAKGSQDKARANWIEPLAGLGSGRNPNHARRLSAGICRGREARPRGEDQE